MRILLAALIFTFTHIRATSMSTCAKCHVEDDKDAGVHCYANQTAFEHDPTKPIASGLPVEARSQAPRSPLVRCAPAKLRSLPFDLVFV